ncbi:hypothetical protein ABIA30_004438 [Mycobacterium sp. MAA66]|uniref:hypothetical protein n=1 Tax=Mycobacterium sp. MAA66 TaxID=3156297 RepID=UPI0035131495
MLRSAAAVLLLAVAAMPAASADAVLPEVAANTGAVTFVDNPGISDPRPLPPQSWSRLDPQPQLALNFEIGSPECNGVHATVQETDQTVTVTLATGRRYTRARMVCTMIMVPGTIVVPLAGPVGDRTVLTS